MLIIRCLPISPSKSVQVWAMKKCEVGFWLLHVCAMLHIVAYLPGFANDASGRLLEGRRRGIDGTSTLFLLLPRF